MAELTNQTTFENVVLVLKNGSVEGWAKTNYRLSKGELGIGYLDNGNVIVKAGKDGTTEWKDLPQVEGVFEEDQILTYNFGRHTIANGYVNAGGKGMTTSEWLLDALSVTKDPTVTQPSFSMANDTVTTTIGSTEITSGNREIGSKVTKVKWNGTFSAGSYEYGSKIGDTKYTDTGTGVTASYKVSCDVPGSFVDGVDGTVTFTNPVVLDSTSEKTIATVTNTCTWGDSPRTPVNNVGATKDSLKISGSSSEKSTTFKLTAYREGCFYGTVSSKTAPENLTSATIRGLANKTKANYASGTKALTVPVGAATIVIACPANKTGVTKVYNNTVNADMTTSFTKTENVSVYGANDSYAENYNVWTFTPNDAYGTETSLTITLG